MKKVKKVLSFLLVFCMILTIMPMGVYATDLEESSAAADDLISEATPTPVPAEDIPADDPVEEDPTPAPTEQPTPAPAEEPASYGITPYSGEASVSCKIVHLDCGRKYFTKEWIIALINEIAVDGYNQLQLAFGNDGLRFLLDDMSFTANGTTYSHDSVVSAVESGNAAQNSSGDKSWLTQSDMDEIIAAAKAKGIEIVPLLNLPGHANALLDIASDKYNYSSSQNTLDVTNDSAVNFAYALFTKYVDYFAGKGCKFFNFGADEFANDIYANSFAGLTSNRYNSFVSFINKLAAYIENKSMTPRAFNDGLYYGTYSDVSINTNIQCCYWSNGWGGYNVAAPATIAEKGHAMINTNGDFYYVLGKSDQFDSGYSYASNFSNTAFMGGTVSNPVGSMFCIWCDYPNAETETKIAQNTRLVLRAMAKRMNNKSIEKLDTSVVSGGFNADGTLNTQEEPTPTPAPTAQPDEPVKYDETIELEIGGTKNKTQENVNNENNVDRIHLDESIATVEVTGTDAVEATTTYTKASVTCDTLISRNSNSWTAVSSYYYKADDGNYYPLYAKRSWSISWSGFSYTYTWGYSTTSSTSNVTQIGTQSTTDTSTVPNITVYTQSKTDAVEASTTVTFTGVYPGTTYVTVGETTYKIVVNYKKETVNLVIDGTETRSQNRPITSDPQITGDTDAVEVSVSGSSITFKGLAVGTATVTVGNTIYKVNVTEEDLTQVTPLTIEYWITNQRVKIPYDSSNESMTVSADVDGVHSEDGVDVGGIVPATNGDPDQEKVLWKVVRLPAGYHQEENSSDMTTSEQAVTITKIRYWNGTWSYYNGTAWKDVADSDQIVAYYLMKTQVTSEVVTEVVDWGQDYAEWKEGTDNGWFWNGYVENGSKYVFLDFAVVYEDGTQNPSSFPTDNTWFFHFDGCSATNPRVLKPMMFLSNDEYEIWKVTVTDGTSSGYEKVDTFTSTYNNTTETVVWDESMGGDPMIESLSYTANRSGKLVRIYVRTKMTEDSLTVHYVDQNANQEFYNYNIAVNSGTTFDPGFALVKDYTNIADALINNTVTNSLGVAQTVTADLSKMTEIGAQYRYSTYRCVDVKFGTNEDGTPNYKDVYICYEFSNTHSFVIDFGLPLNISTDNLGIEGDWTDASISGAQYGTATTSVGKGITYTPTQTLKGVETLQLTLKDNDGVSVTHQIYIYPATTVYYEEGFATYEGGWNDVGSKGTGNQTASTVGSQARYGFDSQYAETVGPSNGTEATCGGRSTGQTATFEFTGTGVEIYTNNTDSSGSVMASIYNATTNAHVKTYIVHTAMQNGGAATQNQKVTAYNVPIISARDLAHGRYKVVIKHVKSSASDTTIAPVSIDGFRVHGTLASDTQAYVADLEENPTFIELRDKVLAGLNVNDIQNSQYKVAGEIIQQVYDKNSSTEGAVVLSKNETYGDSTDVQDLLDNGPKNELYLQKDQAVVFKVTTNRVVQIGLKALNANTTYTINNGDLQTLNTSTDMFYKALDSANNDSEREAVITITNKGTGILSITLVKICDDPNAAFASLTEEDLIPALLSLGFEDKATSTPEPTAEPTIEPTATPEPTAEPTPVVTPTPAPTNPPKPVVPNNPIQDFFNTVRNILNKWFGW